ncbi:DUF397 domain-containing protein [Amycolatopsis sp. WAC 04169]|uniref:DUF397 domain-containing protein n=1 Tax=Amycolatopsis TaxID=1813 RepID=UPI00087C9B9B|nr:MULTISPECIES: DUF397 domain-containing protein [Amycolatopsis]OLZ58951.1 DUF397 domain-containing protein [Amycolatopsis keratiniphila subsp. nogabecina]RSN31666.1 DUF397 domain-containing protein [Amycolatopsis sp. WAC 04169]SDU69255.1 protein of unknown function [Amycolatopsis keratiniphila]
MSEQPVDDKAHIRPDLDLSDAVWIRAEPEGANLEDRAEYALVPHTDGVTYTAMRQASDPDGHILVFTPTEWDAFVKGVRDGEFDLPA